MHTLVKVSGVANSPAHLQCFRAGPITIKRSAAAPADVSTDVKAAVASVGIGVKAQKQVHQAAGLEGTAVVLTVADQRAAHNRQVA